MSCPTCNGITLFKGADGKTIYNGSGAPTILTANVGDFYIDTTAWEIYGPYTGSSWGSGTSLIGPTGANGTNGTNGTNGVDGTTLSTLLYLGDFLLNGPGTLPTVTITSADFPNNGDTIQYTFYLDTDATTTGDLAIIVNGASVTTKTLAAVRNTHKVEALLHKSGLNLSGTFTIIPINTNDSVSGNWEANLTVSVPNFFSNPTNTLNAELTGNDAIIYFPTIKKLLI